MVEDTTKSFREFQQCIVFLLNILINGTDGMYRIIVFTAYHKLFLWLCAICYLLVKGGSVARDLGMISITIFIVNGL